MHDQNNDWNVTWTYRAGPGAAASASKVPALPGPEARPESRSAVAKLIDSIPTEPAKSAEGSQGKHHIVLAWDCFDTWPLAGWMADWWLTMVSVALLCMQPWSCSTRSSSTAQSWTLSRSQAIAVPLSAGGWVHAGPAHHGMHPGRCIASFQDTWDGSALSLWTPKMTGSAPGQR